jgi:hypothetical protein
MDKTNEVAIGTSEKVHILNLMQWNSWIHEHMKKSFMNISYEHLFA